MNRRDARGYVLYVLAVLLVVAPHYAWNVTVHKYLEIPLSPLFRTVHWMESGVDTVTSFTADRSKLLRIISRLNTRNRELRTRVRSLELVKRKYTRLRDDLRLPGDTFSGTVHPAEVVQTQFSEWERVVRVTGGSANGFEVGNPVLVPQSDTWILLGKIHTVRKHHSVLTLSSDPRFNVGVMIEGIPRRQFVARGAGHEGLRVKHFPRILNVPLNAAVRTAPASSLAPPELLVGTVRSVSRSRSRPRIGNVLYISSPVQQRLPDVLWVLKSG